MNTVLITGGAGLVGSTLCEMLLNRSVEVFCVDDLSLGTLQHIEEFKANPKFHFQKCNVSKPNWFKQLTDFKFDALFHLAANSDISIGVKNPELEFERTFTTTLQSLHACKDLKIPNFIFSSTSAVYGANPIFPTPEDTQCLYPVSHYGAAKLASEAAISSFVEAYGLNAWIFRFGNVVGQKLTHGVIFDFIRKLTQNPKELVVLGDGNQTKTYIDVMDCIEGMLGAFEKSPAQKSHKSRYQVFNLSTDGTTSVKTIAEKTVRILGTQAVIKYGNSATGWVGDVSRTYLSVEKMKALGWQAKRSSDASVYKAIEQHREWVSRSWNP